ncbi:MFS transporter [Celeribacter indicus]|uniref:Major facilitator superfamily (MFS) transporter n=1 Tax=Celeribacter indicus TaxID=1208324 RepID=A0A0B5DM58_9RHOB|nr:MFS transporter [Celeribacter indicus]AJE44743.1 major facilitator superfamily (MFS) transporter [Celeribacter indicus]SDX50054.1 MFS transporter, UMF1 family [Celeribacter indicus]
MDAPVHRKRIWGWMMYDWATQPFHTLILTFIFGPYFAEQVIASLVAGGMDAAHAKAEAQSIWGYGLTITGLLIAFSAPLLGAVADESKRRMPWIRVFSLLYVIGSAGLWIARPEDFPTTAVLVFFGLGLIGVEFTTIFTNALLPALGSREEIGKISGDGWAWGYVGGILALVIMLLFFAENADGVTLLGSPPLFGFDPAAREGTRFVGPFVALWFVLSMIPFFLWVREPKLPGLGMAGAVRKGLRDLRQTIASLPRRKSLFAYLASSMFYRDALNGVFTFGGIYALGALEWSVVQVGVFGILGALSGAIFTYFGGLADRRHGPKPVIRASILVLIATCLVILTITRESALFVTVGRDSALPDIAFYICGVSLGAVAGVLQSASRTTMVRQADPARMTEAFGLYALSGKATSFLAPALIAVISDITNSQRAGITPLIALFIVGLVLLAWVHPEGEKVTDHA